MLPAKHRSSTTARPGRPQWSTWPRQSANIGRCGSQQALCSLRRGASNLGLTALQILWQRGIFPVIHGLHGYRFAHLRPLLFCVLNVSLDPASKARAVKVTQGRTTKTATSRGLCSLLTLLPTLAVDTPTPMGNLAMDRQLLRSSRVS